MSTTVAAPRLSHSEIRSRAMGRFERLGIPLERLAQSSDDELYEMVTAACQEQGKQACTPGAPVSQPDWREQARAKGAAARDEAMKVLASKIAEVPALEEYFHRCQFPGALYEQHVKELHSRIRVVADVYATHVFLSLATVPRKEWLSDEIYKGIKERSEESAMQHGIKADWSAVYRLTTADVLNGLVPSYTSGQIYRPFTGASFDPELLLGLQPEEKTKVWAVWSASLALSRYMEEAWTSMQEISRDVQQLLVTHLHRAVQIDRRCTRVPVKTFTQKWESLVRCRELLTDPEPCTFDGNSEDRDDQFETDSELLLATLRELVDGQAQQSWIGRRLTWPLDDIVLSLPGCRPLSTRNFCEGMLVTGAIGGGKTTFFRFLVDAHLKKQAGALFMCFKTEAAQENREFAIRAGREKDIVEINPENIEEYAIAPWEEELRETGSVLDTVELFLDAGEAASSKGSGGDEKSIFFRANATALMTPIVSLLWRANAGVNPIRVSEVLLEMKGMPAGRPLTDTEKKAFSAETTVLGRLFEKARAWAGDDPEDVKSVQRWWDFIFTTWPAFASETRMSFVGYIEPALLFLLEDETLRKGLSGPERFSPREILDGKIVILNITENNVGAQPAAIFNSLMKRRLQKCLERRRLGRPFNEEDDMRTVLILSDEYQKSTHRADNDFTSIARSNRAVFICLTQSEPAINAKVGGNEKDQTIAALKNNLRIKVYCQNDDPTTNEAASKLIGQYKEKLHSRSTNTQRSRPGSIVLAALTDGFDGAARAANAHLAKGETSSYNESYQYWVRTDEFSKLANGSPEYGNIVEVIVFYHGYGPVGRPEPYFRASFPRNAELPMTPVTYWDDVQAAKAAAAKVASSGANGASSSAKRGARKGFIRRALGAIFTPGGN
ncbi:hypothetical protein DB347_17905 [Opitutaceae bacterium EW11]|nr:hypothetical protein DB347_17905 [Opitutaceae bacterium EW11]